MLAKMTTIGEASGIGVETEAAIVATLKNGRVIREEHHIGRDTVEVVVLERPVEA